MKKVMVAMVLALGFMFMTGCPDDTDDCTSDPSLCDSDTDADADSDTPVQYGRLTVTSTPVQGASIELDGDPSGQVTDHTFENLMTGAHSVLLSLAGWIDAPAVAGGVARQVEVVNENTTEVTVLLGRDLTGRWRDEATRDVVEVTMAHRNSITIVTPTSACPDTEIFARGFAPMNVLCVEGEYISLCKTRASECGTSFAEGSISGDGRRVEFTTYHTGIPNTLVYTKID